MKRVSVRRDYSLPVDIPHIRAEFGQLACVSVQGPESGCALYQTKEGGSRCVGVYIRSDTAFSDAPIKDCLDKLQVASEH